MEDRRREYQPSTRVRGRMSAAKEAALATLGPRYGIDLAPAAAPGRVEPLDPPGPTGALGERLDQAFGRRSDRLVDVGVGNGEATVAWAATHPARDVVAVEVHPPSVATTLAAIDAAGSTNVRVVAVDVRALLAGAAPGDVHDVRLLFPDPWPKRRHLARRLVDAAFVATVAEVLPTGGTLHVATDWPDYARQVAAVAAADGRFTVEAAAPRPDRPVTTYEAIGLAAGRPITDVVATRTV